MCCLCKLLCVCPQLKKSVLTQQTLRTKMFMNIKQQKIPALFLLLVICLLYVTAAFKFCFTFVNRSYTSHQLHSAQFFNKTANWLEWSVHYKLWIMHLCQLLSLLYPRIQFKFDLCYCICHHYRITYFCWPETKLSLSDFNSKNIFA